MFKKAVAFGLTVSLFLAGTFITISPVETQAQTIKRSAVGDPVFVLDHNDKEKGYVTIQADYDVTEGYKVIVTRGDQKYLYDYYDIQQNYPLQMGDGKYHIGLYKPLGGNKYTVSKQWNIDVVIEKENNIYLISNSLINWYEESAVAIEAQKIVKSLKTDREKAIAIYNYILNNFKYDHKKIAGLQAGYTPDTDLVLEEKQGICYDFSALYAVMLRSVDIPAKLVMGKTSYVKEYHSWNEVYLDGKWVTIDTSYDSQAKAAKVKYSMEKPTSRYEMEKEY